MAEGVECADIFNQALVISVREDLGLFSEGILESIFVELKGEKVIGEVCRDHEGDNVFHMGITPLNMFAYTLG